MDKSRLSIRRVKLFYSRPHQHGEELLPPLSKILNDCRDESQTAAAALALQALQALCEAEVGILNVCREVLTLQALCEAEVGILNVCREVLTLQALCEAEVGILNVCREVLTLQALCEAEVGILNVCREVLTLQALCEAEVGILNVCREVSTLKALWEAEVGILNVCREILDSTGSVGSRHRVFSISAETWLCSCHRLYVKLR